MARLLALAGVLLIVTFGAGPAAAGLADYSSPLYLSKAPSGSLAGAHQLLTSPGTATPSTAPTTAVTAGAGMPTGFYRYSYSIVDANGSETEPSPVSTPDVQTTAGNQNVLVGGLPTGVTVRLYRKRSTTIVPFRVAELVNNASPTYLDSSGDPPAGSIALPQSQNRVAWVFMNPYSCMATNCGYEEFRPGTPVPNAATSFPVSPPSASPTPSANGWVVEASGDNLAFAAGDWTFRVQVKSGPMPTGTAHLAVGMWKVTPAGPTYSTALVDPAAAGEQTATNLVDTSNAFRQITHTVSVPAFTLAPGERLYVQFWRRQTAPYQSASANDARVLTLAAQDGYSRIEHPGVSTLPSVPSLSAPAGGAFVAPGPPDLSGVFSDPDAGDTGTLEFRVCLTLTGGAGSDCADVERSGSSPTVANGSSALWTVDPALPPGTYFWQARARDAVGASAWSSTRSFTVHQLPAVPALVSPADGMYTASATSVLEGSYSDADLDAGVLRFRVCSSSALAGAACAGLVDSGSSPLLASGSNGQWTTSALSPGVYHWQARAEDAHGASSAWTATRSLTVHVTPAGPALGSPAAGAQVRTATPTLSASYSDPDADPGIVLFRVCRNASSAGSPCAGKAAAGESATVASGAPASWVVAPELADGRYFWQARAEDQNGAKSAWTATRRLDVAKHLIRTLSLENLKCSVGMRLSSVVKLARGASVKARFHTAGRVDLVRSFGRLDAGRSTLRVFLSYSLERPAVYWIEWRAERSGEVESEWTRVALKPLPRSGVPFCRPA